MLDTMVASKTNPDENYLQAIFEFGCKSRGSDRLSYPTVVAGGLNATKLHYESNNHPIKSTDLVLVDGGAQYGHYNSDVARTWPVSGKFTEAQQEIYEAVLFVNKAIIATLENGAKKSMDGLYSFAIVVLTQKLFDLGFFVPFDNMGLISFDS